MMSHVGAERPRTVRPKTTTRDLDATSRSLEAWLTTRLPGATVHDLAAPPTNGMSSETLLFRVVHDGGEEGLVARVPPDPANFPVFPVYDIPGQFRIMREVREACDVPVPEVLWQEDDPSVLGQPFFVMRRVEGIVPPDVMPYPFGGNWLHDADPADQERLARRSIETLAALHAIPDAAHRFVWLHDGVPGETPLRRHVRQHVEDYYAWASTETESPLIERCLAWLHDTWPGDEGPTVMSWGDARIGNMLFRDFEPVAVLDWEMASLGPREIDLAWFWFLHHWFNGLARNYGLPGMPDFLRLDDVLSTYERVSGHTPSGIEWYLALAAIRHGIVCLRTGIRGVRFGEAEMPAEVDDLISHRSMLEAIVDGTYDWRS